MQPWLGPKWKEDSLYSQAEWLRSMSADKGVHVWVMTSWTKVISDSSFEFHLGHLGGIIIWGMLFWAMSVIPKPRRLLNGVFVCCISMPFEASWRTFVVQRPTIVGERAWTHRRAGDAAGFGRLHVRIGLYPGKGAHAAPGLFVMMVEGDSCCYIHFFLYSPHLAVLVAPWAERFGPAAVCVWDRLWRRRSSS